MDWNRNTSTVYVGEKPKVTYNNCKVDESIKRHKHYKGTELNIWGPETSKICQQDFWVFNRFNGYSPCRGSYLINGNHTKIKNMGD